MIEGINEYVKTWRSRGYSNDIPDEVPDDLMELCLAPSYKAIAFAILKNDHACISLGQERRSSEWYGAIKRIEISKRQPIPGQQLRLTWE